MKKTLHPEKLSAFLASGKLLNFKRKEVILLDAVETIPLFYWIKAGYIKVCSNAKSGNERIHYIYGPNDLFPIGWLLTGSPQWISFVALDNVQVLVKNIKDFKEFIADEPLLFTEITRMQLNAHDRIYGLSLDSPEERIAHSLIMLALRFGKESGPHMIIDVPLSQQEFADMVRMSRETAGKALNELEDKGYLILGRKRILIDLPKLSKVFED